MPSMTDSERRQRAARLRALIARCREDPDRFNSVILGRGPYWARQREVVESVVKYPATYVQTGNGVGKSYADAGVLHWFLVTHPGSIVLATAPSNVQLEEVLWKEVERAYKHSRIPLGGRLLKSPLKVDLGEGWQALAYSTNNTERFSGHHKTDLLAILDEASGVAPAIWEAIGGVNPSRVLATGNPLTPDGPFYERCCKAELDDTGQANLITISSLESPDIHLERSERGLADAGFLRKARHDYGEGSLWWRPHVLGLFPAEAADALLQREWLDLAARTIRSVLEPGGRRRLAIDLGGGTGGDRTVLLVRDDLGVLHLEAHRTMTLETTAARAKALLDEWSIDPRDVSYDKGGIGWDFANRLQFAGIVGARGYLGGIDGGVHKNLRSAAAWRMRQRLDPAHHAAGRGGVLVPQRPFAVRAEVLASGLRRELQALRYGLTGTGGIALEAKEELVKRLGGSPDLADALIQSFAF